MRLRILPLPGTPFVLVIDRLGEEPISVEAAQQLRAQTGASAVFADTGDVELEAVAYADESEGQKALAAMAVAGDMEGLVL